MKGNRPDGDILVHCWENLLDLKPQCLPDLLPPVLLKYTWLTSGKDTSGGRFFPFHYLEFCGLGGKTLGYGNRNKLNRDKGPLQRGFSVGGLTFLLSILLTLVANSVLTLFGLFGAILVVLLIVCTGVVFDIIGMAVTATGESSFHSMAAKKVYGAAQAIRLVRHADRVSSFCNDVVGDICGTVSGAAAASIVFNLFLRGLIVEQAVASLFIVGLVAALTVGGKAAGKYLALYRCREITFEVGRLLAWVESRLGLSILVGKGKMRRR